MGAEDIRHSPSPAVDAREQAARERMDIVVVGHVDHGKSTVIGRLLADTGSLPEGKLDHVRAMCAKNARPFEYAFLLDALKAEQAQGITIDTARCFFKTPARDYIIHDAPGHVEFLKNMVTGASRAEAALLLIDAHEGVQENSKRHGYILSLLGIRQVAVLLNKMDLVGWRQDAFEAVRDEYAAFLAHLGVRPATYIPVSAREGANIAEPAAEMPWYDGPTVLGQLDAFRRLSLAEDRRPFRMPVQDVYKFTAEGDDRRIVAGTVESGRLSVGDEVVFLPSGKRSHVRSLEVLQGEPPTSVGAEEAVGFTLTTQIYARSGELVVRADEAPPRIARRFSANLFWLGRAPLVRGKRYGLKLGAAHVPVELVRVTNVLDASELTSVAGAQQIERHEVGECVFETTRPIAFDLTDELEKTARFVIVDGFEIAGCGVILREAAEEASLLEQHVQRRERTWERGGVTAYERHVRSGHAGKAVVFVGPTDECVPLARALERRLFERGFQTYYLGPKTAVGGLDDASGTRGALEREANLRHLGELARVMTDAGLLFVTALDGVDAYDLEALRILNAPNELFVVASASADNALEAHVVLGHTGADESLERVIGSLGEAGVIGDYSI